MGRSARPFVFSTNKPKKIDNMSCSQTLAGITRDCANSMGGIRRAWAIPFDDVTAVTISNDKVASFTLGASKKWSKYEFRPQTAEMTHTPQVNSENGVAYVQTALSVAFAKMDTAKRLEMNALALSDLRFIVEDNNGAKWLLGYDNPVTANGGESGTGKAYGDRNGYGISFIDNSLLYPYELAADCTITE